MNDVNQNPKNYDPRMHSAEHILNQTMVRMFDCGRAFSAHIEKKKSKCDYRLDRDLTADEVAEIERRVNDVIRADMSVREGFIPRSAAQAQFSLSRLPEEAGDTIRVITIGDYDTCPCSGIHVATTKEIGVFRLASTDYADGVLRIRFKIQPLGA
jgi:alanyl-tRNA synthetase